MTPKARLLTEQRRRSVLDLVDQEGHVTVADMVKRFSISAVTVRNDLDALASIGAVLRSVSCSFVGPQAEAMMNEFHADRLFLAVDGFDLENGPSTPDVLEAQLNNVMIRSAKEVNVVTDFSKLGRRSVSKIGPFDRIRRLITDNRATQDFTEALRKKGIEVIEV